jgi:hypothetical protein
MTETVAIRLNKRRLIENLRFAFPNRYSVVTELLQNARRAGASSVALTYDAGAKRLVVRDDGCGIADFQTLLTLGESGWSEAVQRAEHPFGLGFLQSLYAAGRCTVESGGRRVGFDTRAALAGATVAVERGTDTRGTTVTLEEVELPRLDREIVRMTRGFPIPVHFNGVVLRRPHAPDALPYVETSIGRVHLAGLEDGAVTRETAVYLQGLMIEGPMLLGSSCNVVHLDSKAFRARLPDRDRLMEQDAQLKRVEKVLSTLWRDRLVAAKRVATPEVFAARCFRAATLWGHLDLFNDVPVLPEGVLRRVVGYPVREGLEGARFLVPFRRPLARSEVESGRLRLACLSPFDDQSAVRWMYARERAYLVFEAWAVAAEHWAFAHVRRLDEEPVSVEAVNPGPRTSLAGRRIEAAVLACEAVEIRVGDDRVVIRDEAVYRPGDNTILVPENESSGQAVRQVSNFIDRRGDWCEADERADVGALEEAIALLRSTNPAGAFLRLIAEARPERYPSLRGKRFTVEVGETPHQHRVAAET